MGNVWSALADESRRKILKLLKKGSMNAGEISQHFNFTKATLSHHLSILKEANLVECKKVGQQQVYTLNATVFQQFMISVKDFFSKKGDKNE